MQNRREMLEAAVPSDIHSQLAIIQAIGEFAGSHSVAIQKRTEQPSPIRITQQAVANH